VEQIGTPGQVLDDVQVKVARVHAFLAQEGLDALVLGRQDHFAWITAGGDSSVIATSEMGFACLVITPTGQWLVSHSMDGQRFLDEQARDQGYELVTLRWHEGSVEDRVLQLTRGMKVAADFGLPGAVRCDARIVDLHYPLTDLDLARCRWIGQTANRILTEAAQALRPGVAEQEVAARLLYEYALAGIKIDVLIVGFDERIRRYRHPMPTGNVLQRYALLHPAARRWGLHANVTRLVHFGEPPAETRRAMDGVAVLGARVAAMLAPGVRFADILAEEKRTYAELGYPDQWHYHFQGGITGYTLADPARCLDPEARLVERQAYDYFLTITGSKFEELMLLTEQGVEFASLGPGWPARKMATPGGEIAIPDVWIRE
jgi:Xaa-Pro dipeptidase